MSNVGQITRCILASEFHKWESHNIWWAWFFNKHGLSSRYSTVSRQGSACSTGFLMAQMPRNKAPGPNDHTSIFFNSCWETIKCDLIAAINSFHNSRCADLNLLNKVTIILISRKDGAEDITDFRPISLIHTIAKIITKILALRLAQFMNELILPCQSAFIKERSICDNFLYVRNLSCRFHINKRPTLLMKLDISKAFDSVRWDYLLMMMQHRGFPLKWRNWITTILTTLTSRIFLNGIPMEPIHHGKGLHQGDPLSLLLFILAIDPTTTTHGNGH